MQHWFGTLKKKEHLNKVNKLVLLFAFIVYCIWIYVYGCIQYTILYMRILVALFKAVLQSANEKYAVWVYQPHTMYFQAGLRKSHCC